MTDFVGSAGNDTLVGGAGADRLYGGAGNDTLTIDLGDLLADGGEGIDTLILGWTSYSTQALNIDLTNLWSGGAGFINGVEIRGIERISRFNGSNLADRIVFGAGNRSAAFNLSVDLGGGDDYAYGSDFTDTISGGAGNDTIYSGRGGGSLYGNDGDDTLYGGADSDFLNGGAGADKLYGDAGDDTLVAAGDDTIDGGSGFDTLWIDKNLGNPGMNVDLRALWSGGVGKFNGGTVVNVENIWDIDGTDSADILIVGDGVVAMIDFYYEDGREPFPGLILRGYAGDDVIVGSGGVDRLYGDQGADTLSGGKGDDVLNGGQGADVIDGGDGYDTAEFNGASADYTWTLLADGAFKVQDRRGDAGDGVDSLRNIEALKFSDRTVVIGTSGAIRGTLGNDRLQGTSGDDVIDGREGQDTVVYKGAFPDFTITWTVDGWRIADQKTGADRSGVDIVRNVENVIFSDGVVRGLGDGMASVGTNILRLTSPWPVTTDFSNRLVSGALNASQALVEIIAKAGATTSVATLAYEFFTGKIPSQAGIDYLVSPTGPNINNLNSTYYQAFNLENRYINFAVNLGRDGEGKAAFTAKYGSLSLFDATREAYKTIFGAAPTDAKIHALIDTRINYFASYGGDGANGIGTKAAMVGWLLAEAQKADLGVMVRSNDAWLTDLADGSTPFAIDILDPGKGYWKADFIFGGN